MKLWNTLILVAGAISTLAILAGVGWSANEYSNRIEKLEREYVEQNDTLSDQSQKIGVLVDYNARRATEDEYRRKACKSGAMKGPQCWDVVPGKEPSEAATAPLPDVSSEPPNTR